jgi:hypothetical protein
VLAAVDAWMQRQECLQVKRQFADRIVWEARRDLVGAVRRAFNVGGRGYALSRAHDVAATAVAVDEGRTLVHLDADLGAYRSSLAKQTAGLSALGVVSTGAMIALGFMVPIAVVPAVVVSAGSFYGARGMNARVLTAAQLALEQLLDRLERGELTKQQPSLLNMLAYVEPRRAHRAGCRSLVRRTPCGHRSRVCAQSRNKPSHHRRRQRPAAVQAPRRFRAASS